MDLDTPDPRFIHDRRVESPRFGAVVPHDLPQAMSLALGILQLGNGSVADNAFESAGPFAGTCVVRDDPNLALKSETDVRIGFEKVNFTAAARRVEIDPTAVKAKIERNEIGLVVARHRQVHHIAACYDRIDLPSIRNLFLFSAHDNYLPTI